MVRRNASDELAIFFKAAESNDLETVKRFIEKEHAPMSIGNHDRQNVAHLAAKNGHLDMVRYLVEKEPTIRETRDVFGNTLLFLAIEKGSLDMVKYLVEEHKEEICQRHPLNWECTTINAAIKFDHFDILKYFLEEKNGDVNFINNMHQPSVFSAVEFQRHDMLKYLVEERNANLKMKDVSKENILYVAVKKDDLPSMKYILDERKVKFNINSRNRLGDTLVLKASVLNRLAILEYLVGEKHADVNVRENENMIALHCAAFQNHYDICKYLIEHGANTEAVDNFGKKPIEKATNESLIEYMKNVSKTRSRRSVSSPNSAFREISILTSGCSGDDIFRLTDRSVVNAGTAIGGILNLCEAIYSSHFQSFLVVATVVVRSVRKVQHSIFGPREILQDRMDAIAVESVDSLLIWNKSRPGTKFS